MIRRMPRVGELRAALWAERALRATRRRLARGELREGVVPTPPRLPRSAVRGLDGWLRCRPHTCLEGALLRQRWLAAHGVNCDVVIGVRSPAAGFSAHAWLVGPGGSEPDRDHLEISRLAP